jgi:hypothetical protein
VRAVPQASPVNRIFSFGSQTKPSPGVGHAEPAEFDTAFSVTKTTRAQRGGFSLVAATSGRLFAEF